MARELGEAAAGLVDGSFVGIVDCRVVDSLLWKNGERSGGSELRGDDHVTRLMRHPRMKRRPSCLAIICLAVNLPSNHLPCNKSIPSPRCQQPESPRHVLFSRVYRARTDIIRDKQASPVSATTRNAMAAPLAEMLQRRVLYVFPCCCFSRLFRQKNGKESRPPAARSRRRQSRRRHRRGRRRGRRRAGPGGRRATRCRGAEQRRWRGPFARRGVAWRACGPRGAASRACRRRRRSCCPGPSHRRQTRCACGRGPTTGWRAARRQSRWSRRGT